MSLAGDRLRYRLILDTGTTIVVDQDDVLHVPGSAEWDGVTAMTPIRAMSAAVGLGIEADRFAQSYFENDAAPSGYISYPQVYKGDKDELRGFWRRTFGKSGRNSGPAVLDQGGTYNRIPISAQDAQLLDTRRFQIEDIARIFGVPRFLLGMDETSWGSGIEALGIGFVTYTLDPHLVAIEDEVNHKLYGRGRPARPGRNPPRFLGEFDRDVLVRGNIESRFKAYRLALGGSSGPGWMTPNEVRRKQNDRARPTATASPPGSPRPPSRNPPPMHRLIQLLNSNRGAGHRLVQAADGESVTLYVYDAIGEAYGVDPQPSCATSRASPPARSICGSTRRAATSSAPAR